MAHNLRTRTDLAAWSSPTAAVMPAEYDKLDGYAASAINGDAGGTWAPSSAITIGGAGMVITGLLWIQGSLGILSYAPAQFQNTVTILNTLTVTGGLFTANDGAHISGGPLTVDSPAVFNSTLNIFDDLTVHTSGAFLAAGDSQIGNDSSKTLLVEATATLNGDVQANGSFDFFDDVTIHSAALLNAAGNVTLGLDSSKTLTVAATSAFNATARFNQQADFYGANIFVHSATTLNCDGPVALNHAVNLGTGGGDAIDVPGTMNLHEPLAYSFNGRVPSRPILASDGDHTYGVTDGNEILYPNIAADRHLTLSTSGAKAGDSWDVCLPNAGGGTGNLLTISDGTFTIGFLRAKAGNYAVANIRFVSGSWRVFYQT